MNEYKSKEDFLKIVLFLPEMSLKIKKRKETDFFSNQVDQA